MSTAGLLVLTVILAGCAAYCALLVLITRFLSIGDDHDQ